MYAAILSPGWGAIESAQAAKDLTSEGLHCVVPRGKITLVLSQPPLCHEPVALK